MAGAGKNAVGTKKKSGQKEKTEQYKIKEIKQKKPTNKAEPKKKKERPEESEPSFFSQAAPYLLCVLALLLTVCLIWPDAAGAFGRGVYTVSFGLFSGASYTIPLFFVYLALFWRTDDKKNILLRRLLCSLGTFVLLAVMIHIFTGAERTLNVVSLFADGAAKKGGGAIGGFIGALLLRVFGTVGTLIIVFAALILFVMAMLGATPLTCATYIRYKIHIAREKRAAAAERDKFISGGKPRRDKSAAADAPAEAPLPLLPEAPKKVKKEIFHVRPVKKPHIDENVFAEPEPADSMSSTGARADIDEAIFEEVMRNTREREASGNADTPYDTSGTRTVLDINEVNDKAAAVSADAAGDTSGNEPAGAAATEKIEPANARGEDPLRKIFLNPEDAAILDRIAKGKEKPEAVIIGGEHETEQGDDEESAGENPPALSVKRESVGALAASSKDEQQKPPYVFPPVSMLKSGGGAETESSATREELRENAIKLVDTLRSFNVKTKICDVKHGPTITRYELQPEAGTRVRSIANLVDDIALNLATTGVRIEAPIPGKSAVGIEVPNKAPATVYLRDLIENETFKTAPSKLTACLGADVAGAPVYLDIAKMPHLLIAGATGMGKSVCINSIIVSLLYKSTPDEVKLILVDPKKVELNIYNGIPQLLVPVVSDPKKAAGALAWAVTEMERRFELIEAVGVRNLQNYNEATKNDPDYEFLPNIVIIIDELADLMMTAPDDVENSICRLAQKARAAGMHLIIGTQRPSVDVITGLIKANIPSRIAFTVASQVDSRTIIDIAGAEKLIGRGDMLYAPVSATKPVRVQGAFVSESEVEAITDFIKEKSGGVGYSDSVIDEIEREAARCGAGKKGAASLGGIDGGGGEEDPMLRPAIELAVENGKISTSLIQRCLSLGYGRSAKLIDRMQELGYVSPPNGPKPRDVLITKQQFMELVLRNEA